MPQYATIGSGKIIFIFLKLFFIKKFHQKSTRSFYFVCLEYTLYMCSSEESCYDFYEFVGEMTHPTFRDKALQEPYYEIYHPTDSGIVHATFYIQHTYANIDILKKRLTKKEKDLLSRNNITKADDLKDILVAKEKKKHKEKRKQVRLPTGFSGWPIVFHYINERDDASTKNKKRKALRDCLDRRIDFMNDYVNDFGDMNQTWIKAHIDFIILLQILAAKNNA